MTVGPTTPTPLGLRILVALYVHGPARAELLAVRAWSAPGRGWPLRRRGRAALFAARILQAGGLVSSMGPASYMGTAWQVTDTGAHVARREQERARRRLERQDRRSS